jgi:hypothetical protein
MEEALYQVVISGRIVGSVRTLQGIKAFAKLFGLTQEEAIVLFHEAPRAVRGNLPRALAEKYCRVLHRLGVQCDIQKEIVDVDAGKSIYPRWDNY